MKCVLFLPVVLAFAADAAESPVQKVVTMLKAMSKKGKVELQDEKVQYAKYAQWCASTKSEKSSAIDEASGKVDVLKADISKAQTDAEVLAKEIEEHNAQIEKITAEQTKAKEVREKEAEDYAVELKDYKESVDAIGKALDTMEKQAGSRPQLATGGRHAQEVKALAELALTKPEAAAYDFQSGNINSMLKKLQDQFVTELRELEKAETSKKNSYSLLAESLTNQKSTETEDMERKVGVKAKKLELAASKQDELTTTSSSKDADTKYLDDVSATCSQKAADYESNQKLRTDELEAISKAVQFVSQKLSLLEVKFQSLLQMKRKATSLALLRSTKNDDKLKAKLLGFLQGEAQRLKSAALTNLLEPVATAALGKVKETIEGVIHKLEEQDSQDTEKQTWCASELKSNEKSRREKAVMVDELNADIDLLNASIISLGEEIVTMQRELSDSAQATADAFTRAVVALLGLTLMSSPLTWLGATGPMGQRPRARTTFARRMAVGSGPISQEDLEFLQASGVDMTEVQTDSSVGDFFEALLPKTGVTPDFIGKILLFGLVVTFISAAANALFDKFVLGKDINIDLTGRTSKVGRILRGEDVSNIKEEESELDFYKGTLEDLGKIRDEEARQGLDPLANLGIKRSKKFFGSKES
eukprot:symbB.v1.2.018680.t1/scaffold1410.1/size216244/6